MNKKESKIWSDLKAQYGARTAFIKFVCWRAKSPQEAFERIERMIINSGGRNETTEEGNQSSVPVCQVR